MVFPGVGIAIRQAMTAHRTIVETAVRRRGRTRNPTPPILLINGEHIVASYKIRRPGDAFRIANQVIADELSANLRRPKRKSGGEPCTNTSCSCAARHRLQRCARGHSRSSHGNRSAASNCKSGRNPRNRVVLHLPEPRVQPPPDDIVALEPRRAIHPGMGPNRRPSRLRELRVRFTPVTAIPGHDGTSREQARLLQVLALGFGYTTTASPAHSTPPTSPCRCTSGYTDNSTTTPRPRCSTRHETSANSSSDSRSPQPNTSLTASSGEPERRGTAADARFDLLVERAKRSAPKVFEAPAYPIILIGGRYLITGANAGGYKNAAQLANHTIKKLLANHRH